jgi:plastocyanin
MKKFFGLFILMIAFVAFTGCTQQVVPEPVTTTSPTIVTTPNPTAELTFVPTVLTTVVPTLSPTVKRTESPSGKVVTVIHMKNNAFVPQVLTALPGTGITWINDDDSVHSIKMSGTNNAGFNSGDIMPGASWSYTFSTREGTFNITDPYYPDMKGVVIINKDVHP